MNSDGKKISFGFSKLSKKPNILAPPLKVNEAVELIDCLEGAEIKVKNAIEKVENVPLVIPMKGDANKIISHIEHGKSKKLKNETNEEDTRPDSELTIEELAARQLLREARNKLAQERDTTKVHTLLLNENSKVQDGIEPSMNDYENVPIEDFGLALLRGMGWKEEKSNQSKFVVPDLRPKGLGLGGQKIVDVNTEEVYDKNGKQLVLKEGAFGKIIAGPHKGKFCEVQFCDQWTGRVGVKLAKTNEIVVLNEIFVTLITKEDFSLGSKVINNVKYEEYKEMQDSSNRKKKDKIERAQSASEESVNSESDDFHFKKDKSLSKLKGKYAVKKQYDSSNYETSDEKLKKEKNRARDNSNLRYNEEFKSDDMSSGSKHKSHKQSDRIHDTVSKNSRVENFKNTSGQHSSSRSRDSSEEYNREQTKAKKKYGYREPLEEYTKSKYDRGSNNRYKIKSDKYKERESKSEFRRSRSRDSHVSNDRKKSKTKKSSSSDHQRKQSKNRSRSRSSSREYVKNDKNKDRFKEERTEENSFPDDRRGKHSKKYRQKKYSDEESSDDESRKSKSKKGEKSRRKSYSCSGSEDEYQSSNKGRKRGDTYKSR